MRFMAVILFAIACGLPLLQADDPTKTPKSVPLPKTFQGKFVAEPLSKVLLELTRQTGNTVLVPLTDPDSRVTISLNSTGFWPALDKIAASNECQVDFYHRSGQLTLRHAKVRIEAPVSYDGFFRSSIKKMTATRNLETDQAGLVAQLDVAWEPRLEPLFLETRPQQLVVIDETGKAINIGVEGSVLAPVDGKLALAIDVPLPPLPRSAMKISRLEGKLKVVAPTEMVELTFNNVSRLQEGNRADLSRKKAGLVCWLTKLTMAGNRLSIQVRLDLPPGGPSLESYQSWVVNNDCYLKHKDGTRRNPSGYSLDRSDSRVADLTYHFTDKAVLENPADWTLHYRSPAGLVEIPFAFSFKDVPLP